MIENRAYEIAQMAEYTALAVPFFLAFKTWIRKEIGTRDQWVCRADVEGMNGQCLGGLMLNGGHPLSFSEGYMITVAHYPQHHSERDPKYQNKESGRCLCQCCHALEEMQRGNDWGARKLLDMGVYTREHANGNGGNLYPKVKDVVQGAVDNGYVVK